MPYFTTSDRTQLFYTDTGDGAPIVLVSSAWLSSRMWEYQLPHLAASGCRAVTYDRRGHGRSDWTWHGYDYDSLADDLAALMNHLDLREVTLVGHSMGCGEAVRYLTRHGADRVAGLALVSGTTPFPMRADDNPDGIPRDLMELDLAARSADRPKWFADNAAGFFGTALPGISVSPQLAEFMIRQCLDCSARAAEAFFLSGFTTDLRAEMRAIAVPTIIIHGDHDAQAPHGLCGRRSADLVPASTLITYENAAHGLFVTHADRLSADLAAFARRRIDATAAAG